MEKPPSKILLRRRPDHKGAAILADKVVKFLTDRRVKVVEYEEGLKVDLKEFDLAIAIGGDGTLLRLLHKIKGVIPILGIKNGSYGLLMELSEENLIQGLEHSW